NGIEWMELITHALEEFHLTYGAYPAGFSGEVHREEKFPNFAGALAQKAASALSARGLESQQVFLRFGKPDHMTMLFEEGRLRVQPASEYSKPDHNGAVRDDELVCELCERSSRAIEIVHNGNEKVGIAAARAALELKCPHRV